VLIRLEPGRLELPDSEEGAAQLERAIEAAVRSGLRATLSTGNLLTGSLYVYLEIYPDEAPAKMESFAGHPTIPTIAGGLEGIQVRLSTLLDKLNALPLEELLDGVDRLLADVDAIVASEDMQSLPASLEGTLAQLRDTLNSVSTDSAMQERLLRTITEFDRTLKSLRDLLETLEEQPNALIFNREPGEDPQPPAGSQ
jgi:paraquat-inducible protein B